MPNAHRILVAVDDTDASRRAVSSLGALLAGGGSSEVTLLHLLPPIPQEMLEHGGGRDAAEEVRIEDAQEANQEEWIARATASAKPFLESMGAQLAEHGVAGDAVHLECTDTIPEDRAVDVILSQAKARTCDMIVVGRHSLPWLRDKFHRHVGQELVREAKGFSVLVVE